MRNNFWPIFALAWLLCVAEWSLGGDLRSELRRAQDLETVERYEQAITVYRTVLKGEPKSLQANVGLGRAYFHSNQYPEAADSFGRALQLSPGNAEIVQWLAKSYLRMSEPQKVVELLSHADSIAGHFAWAHLLLAHAFDAQDKLGEATGELQRALALDPHCRGAHFALGFIAWTTRDLETAEKEFRQELALGSREYLTFYYLAETMEVQGKLDEAESVLKKMGSEAPETYLHHLAVGKLDERKQNFETAAGEFRAAIRLDPRQSEAHYHLAVVLRKLGETAQANQEFDLSNQLRVGMSPGSGQGMGRMRPHLPDFD
ncbi:MAG: tetratricopeptide repeat protein [Terriglobia bacterium]|jgi:Flp pilus assembly protein TadD